MAYLRKEKLLIEADAFNPLAAGAEPPKSQSVNRVALEANVRRLNIDVERILPIHGHIVPYSELLARHRQKAGAGEERIAWHEPGASIVTTISRLVR